MLTKLMFTIHRVLGTLLSALFLMWFISGLVMVYHTFPKANPKDKAEKFEPLPPELPSVQEVLNRIPAGEEVKGMSVNRYLGQTVFHIHTDKSSYDLPADSTEQLSPITGQRIENVAALWCQAPIIKVDTLQKLEQWIPFGFLKKELPIYKFYFNDKEKHQLYISSQTGEVLQHTSSNQRFWAWVGVIPHWVYFTWLRQDIDLWKTSVIWLSGIGCIMTIAGLYVGIYVFIRIRRKKGELSSSYKKKWYWWHHVMGTIFGIFVLTWAFSGMMSLADTPQWLAKTHKEYPVRQVMEEGKPIFADYPLDYRKVIKEDGNITQIEWSNFRSKPIYHIHKGSKKESIDASANEVRPLNLTEQEVCEAVNAIHFDEKVDNIRLLDKYDTYYVARSGHLALPVYKVEVNNADHTCYYINPKNGQYRSVNTNKRWGFWMYQGMHSLRFDWLVAHPVLWSIVMWSLMLGGTVVSLSGVVLGIRYIIRLCHRRKKQGK